MSHKNLQLSFFILITATFFTLSFFVFKPYIGVIFLAAIFAVAFYPVFLALLQKFGGRKKLASLATVVIVMVVIIIPTIIISTFVLKEAVSLYNSIAFGGGAKKIIDLLSSLYTDIANLFPSNQNLGFEAEQYIRSGLEWLIGHFDSVFNAVFKGLLGFILLLLSLFYFLVNAERIKELLIMWSPLPDNYDSEVLEALRSSVEAILRGRFLIAIIQGLFLGLGFLIFGVSLPVLWGFVAMVASLVPFLGTTIVTVPAVAVLFINGQIGAAIGVLIWGAVAVGLVDDLLTFFILKKKFKIHPLIILFSVLGGISLFGPLGFVAGPVVVSTFVAMMRIYPSVFSYRNELDRLPK
ncbi:MAG: AI-2E family transporter [Patescibacteria group bacterium]